MRPPATSQDPLRTPLNQIFGSEGNVRILRVLAFATEPMGRTRVARRAELNPSGVRRTLDQLAELGLVEAIGSGRNLSVRLRERHPLAGEIRYLFESEKELFDRIVGAARQAFARRAFPANAVWIENPEARPPGTVHIGVLGSPDVVDEAVTEVRTHFDEVGRELATHFVVHSYTNADLVGLGNEEEERLQDLTLLHGWLPQEWHVSSGGPVRSHQYLEERARRLSTRIAELLPNDPSILDRTVSWIDQRMQVARDSEQEDLKEWRRLLEELSIQQIQAFLREESERADRLRQSLPFVEVLTPAERKELFHSAAS